MSFDKKTYLGDGVYAELDGFQVKLTAENGISVQSVIYLDPIVMHSLLKYWEKVLEDLK